MAKGVIAKQDVINKIAAAFGADYVGEVDKKIYVWGVENGEKVQIALALTCPKVPVESGAAPAPVDTSDGGFNWDAPSVAAPVAPSAPAEISKDEEEKIAQLMSALGL